MAGAVEIGSGIPLKEIGEDNAEETVLSWRQVAALI